MTAKVLIIIFLINCSSFGECNEVIERGEGRGFISALEETLEMKLQEYAILAAKWLEGVNDRHLCDSELGRLINYNKIKPKLEYTETQQRGMKKMAMGMMPLVFHVGATSTWMLITSLMAAKSVAIGIALLVFKIAVSSAKVASFFTALKGKHSDHHHHDWSWTPHHEHHGYERSLPGHDATISQSDWSSYSPEWAGDIMYKTIPEDENVELSVHMVQDRKSARKRSVKAH